MPFIVCRAPSCTGRRGARRDAWSGSKGVVQQQARDSLMLLHALSTAPTQLHLTLHARPQRGTARQPFGPPEQHPPTFMRLNSGRKLMAELTTFDSRSSPAC